MNTTDGNLGVHAPANWKMGLSLAPSHLKDGCQSEYNRLTVAGRRALESYLSHMKLSFTRCETVSQTLVAAAFLLAYFA